MLTSFFGKSSPLNFLLSCSYVLLISILWFFKWYDGSIGSFEIVLMLGVILLLALSAFVFEFTLKKNALTQVNSFAVLLFCLIAALFPSWITEAHIVLASLFLIVAQRRIFSLQSPKNTERKILDASLWIALASFFYFWSLWLFVALYVTIFLKPQKSFRYYFIPIVGILGVFLLATAFYFVIQDSFQWFWDYWNTPSFDFSSYGYFWSLISVSLLFAVLVWTLFFRISKIGSIARKNRSNYSLVIYVLCSCILIALFSSEKSTAELLFIAPPTALIIAGYVEIKSDIWFKEILLWLFVILPVIMVIT